MFNWKHLIQSFDERRDIIIPGNQADTIQFCTQHFLAIAKEAIEKNGKFSVALSGGSTPKVIYENLASPHYRSAIDWQKVELFWSDERAVLPTNSDSNYHMAMQAGFASFSLPEEHIFRMHGEGDIELHAKNYDHLIKLKLNGIFDLVMLGMGEDGHTASLFPRTHALHSNQRLAVANFVPEKETWRMTLTFDCINQARHIAIYVIGKNKAATVKQILNSSFDPDNLPIQKIGTPTHKALWILDKEAASILESELF